MNNRDIATMLMMLGPLVSAPTLGRELRPPQQFKRKATKAAPKRLSRREMKRREADRRRNRR